MLPLLNQVKCQLPLLRQFYSRNLLKFKSYLITCLWFIYPWLLLYCVYLDSKIQCKMYLIMNLTCKVDFKLMTWIQINVANRRSFTCINLLKFLFLLQVQEIHEGLNTLKRMVSDLENKQKTVLGVALPEDSKSRLPTILDFYSQRWSGTIFCTQTKSFFWLCWICCFSL